MSLRQIPFSSLTSEMIPQAIISRPVERIAGKFRILEDYDDFDLFEGVALILNETLHVALKHYQGHKPGTTTVYLPATVSDVDEIAEVVRRLFDELNLPLKDLAWERAERANY